MKIKWLAHAAFLIASDKDTRIITDPYHTTDDLRYGEIKEPADIVIVSHDQHTDHNNVAAVRGNPQVVRKTTEAREIKFKGIPTYHDDVGGSKRGSNTIFCFEVDGLNVCHLGDLGHRLTDEQVAAMGKVDILFIPVGGFFTIDAKTADHVCDQLKPKVIIPMHYKTDKLDFPIAGVDEFIKGKTNVIRVDSSEVEFKPGELPAIAQIMVLKPAL